jgi:diguanylate cyclase
MTDELTQLPNRRMFLTKLRQDVATVERDGGSLTTLMLDLDNFKQLNDTLGHDAGDELLKLVGPRLTGAVSREATVARLGGDEFAVLLDPEASAGVAGEIAAQAVLDSFNEPFRVHGLVLRLTASVGLAGFPGDAGTPEALLKCADVAMYQAKRSRRGFERYSSERDEYTRERLEMSAELAIALESGEIEAAYQPLVDTDSRRICGAEALVRWRRPDGSLRPPCEFLEAAELAGLSRPLTRRMLSLALEQVRDWRAEYAMRSTCL